MRIIENPNPIEETVVTCEKCGCKFAYTKGDMKHESWFNGVLGPGCAGYRKDWVDCPNCGEKHMITDEYSSGYPSLDKSDEEMIKVQVKNIMNDTTPVGNITEIL